MSRLRIGLSAVVAVLAVTGGQAAVQQPAAAAPAGAPPAPLARPVTGLHELHYRQGPAVPVQTGRRFTATAVTWPSPGAWTATVTAPRAGSTRARVASAGVSPLWVQAVAPAEGRYTGPGTLHLSLAARQLAVKLGIPGLLWQVSGLTPGTGGIRAGISYSGFAQAYGGNYGLRLRLVELPGCALTTPQLARCRTETPLRSVNDYKTASVSAVLPLASRETVTGASSVVLAATTSAGAEGGAAGTYGVTSLKPAGSWAEGGSSGSFTYTYPVAVPGASSSLVPSLNLSYDSGSVDGQTAATQAQASWAGDGWSTTDSYIEQSYIPCTDNPEGTVLPSAEQTNDMCYDGNIVTLSLNGKTTSLVYDTTANAWRAQDDDGAVITPSAGANGSGLTGGTHYWELQERDGTTYWFGLNQLPGWASGDATTGSVDYEPVYNPADSNGPCYHNTTFSACRMAYRWHLDYVTDRHGDAMSYYYNQDTNYYAQDHSGSGTGQYIRDSHLAEIDYGFRDGGAYGTVPDQVKYVTASRCFSATCPSITSADSGTPGTDYPDVPYDLNCGNGATCTTTGPTFWSTTRLTTIITRQYSVSAAAYNEVDEYALDESEPATGDGTSPTLWLGGITRTGEDLSAAGPGWSSATLPEVTFGGIDLQNRVDTKNYPGLYRFRIDKITNETGAQTAVNYGTPDTCNATWVENQTASTAASNTNSCYPVYWTPNATMVMDWFEKYAVTSVVTSDTTGGAVAQVTSYVYDSTDGAAWHYDDNEVVQPKYRTYGQFRGYATVTTRTGSGGTGGDPQTEQVTAYYRGMSDNNSSTAVTLTDSQGGTHTDYNHLAGMPLETTVNTGKGGTADHSAIYSYWISAHTADEPRTGLEDLTAVMVAPAEVWTRQALTDGGTTTWRNTETDTTYDTSATDPGFGMPLFAYSHTVPASSAYDRCTTTTYAPANTGTNLSGLVASQETDSVACSGFTEGSTSSVPSGFNTLGAPASVSRPAQVVSATENFYDDTSFSTTFPQTTAPSTGNVTMTRKAVSYASGAFTWQTTSRDTYDQYGRVQNAYDADGNKTVTGYTVNSAGLTTKITVTNPLSQATSETLAPARGLALTSTDANGIITTSQYDALGRCYGVWLDSRSTSGNPNYFYSYGVDQTGVSGIQAGKMGDTGGYAWTDTMVDSLGRPRETQTNTPQGGRLITDTFYDSHGWVIKKSNRYYDSASTPDISIASVADSQVPDQDRYTYNGLGQIIQDTSYSYSNPKATTTTVYNGDRTTVIPPAGGITTATVTDPLGRTSQVQEYTAAPTVKTPSDTFTGIWYLTGGTTTSTSYGYDGHGNQSVITDASGNTWTSQYNLLGQVTSRTDPDTGTTGMSYDGNGNLLQSTDARGAANNGVVSWTYDPLNRKTGEYAATTANQSGGNQLASWVYDNSDNADPGMTYPVGHVTTETRYSGGNSYTIQSAGFNIFGESLGDTYTIPSAAGTGLGGTWAFTHTYTSGNGLPYEDTYPSGGGLPAETTGHTYLASPLDLPGGLGGSIAGYAANSVYDAYGDVTQEQIGENNNGTPDFAYITNTLDPWSLQPADSVLTRTVTPTAVDDETYAYDLSGNVTRQVSTRLGNASAAETQCFAYDLLARLKNAWTATDNCATVPSSSNSTMVGDPLSSLSQYWTTWNYDNLSRLTSQVNHNVTGGTDTTTTDTYDGNSTGQAHTLTTSAQTGGTTASSTFAYNAAGYMTTRNTPATGNQTLSWNNAGQLTQIASTTKGTTSYLYDADGNVLLQEDPGTTILYLPGEQLTLDTSSGTVTGARIIPLPNGGDAVRTGGTSNYYFEIPDQQGSNTVYLDSTAQTPTWRQFTPYGAPRGKTVTWTDNRGFLNQPADTATGLTDLGARQYDPATTQFTAPDPLLKPFDPQDLDPYAYAEDNPVTNTDPSGLLIMGGGGGSCDSNADGCGGSTGSSGGVPEGGTTSYGTTSGNGEAPAAPGTTIFPTSVQPVYNSYYQEYNDKNDNPYLTRADAQWTLDTLHQFCIANEGLCGSLFGKLVANWGSLGGMAAGAVVGMGLEAAGSSTDLPPSAFGDDRSGVSRAAEEQAKLNATATQDIDALAMLQGTNARGAVSRRGSFRVGTVQSAWDNAIEGPAGGRLCPTCGEEVSVAPGTGPRDWDVSHNPSWTNRVFPPDVTRQEVLNNYQEGTSLECQACNRGGGNNDARFNILEAP